MIYDSAVTKDRDIGLIFQSQYAEVGIQLNIVPQDSQVYRENWTAGNFGVLIYSSWGDSYEPYATLAAMAADGDKFNTVQKGMSNRCRRSAMNMRTPAIPFFKRIPAAQAVPMPPNAQKRPGNAGGRGRS